MKRDIQRFLKRNGLDYDVHFYSKSQWQARGEPFGNEAPLSMTFEGPLYDALNYGEWGWRVRDELETLVHSHGFWMEQGYAWSAHFYGD